MHCECVCSCSLCDAVLQVFKLELDPVQPKLPHFNLFFFLVLILISQTINFDFWLKWWK